MKWRGYDLRYFVLGAWTPLKFNSEGRNFPPPARSNFLGPFPGVRSISLNFSFRGSTWRKGKGRKGKVSRSRRTLFPSAIETCKMAPLWARIHASQARQFFSRPFSAPIPYTSALRGWREPIEYNSRGIEACVASPRIRVDTRPIPVCPCAVRSMFCTFYLGEMYY